MALLDKRESYKPFEYDEITRPIIEAIWTSHWTHKEFDFKSDIQDFRTKLTLEEQEVIKRATLIISQIEVSVKSYWSNIGKLIPKPEIADVGATIGGNEVIHSRAYSEVLSILGFEDDFQKTLSLGVVERRVKYLSKYINKIYKDDHKNIVYSIILFTLFTEAVSLFSQFYIILGFNRFNNVMKDLSNVVDYTSKEETIHYLFGVSLINQFRLEYPEIFDDELNNKIKEEAIEAIEAEKGLIEWMLNGYENTFLSSDILIAYVKLRINEGLEKMNFPPVFDVEEKYKEKTQWMNEEIIGSTMTDFFFKKPIDYAKNNKSFNENTLF